LPTKYQAEITKQLAEQADRPVKLNQAEDDTSIKATLRMPNGSYMHLTNATVVSNLNIRRPMGIVEGKAVYNVNGKYVTVDLVEGQVSPELVVSGFGLDTTKNEFAVLKRAPEYDINRLAAEGNPIMLVENQDGTVVAITDPQQVP
jgi:hypothetical protein